MSSRDEFSEKTRRLLCERVQGYCSNPTCGAQTKGPHSDEDRVDSVGMACHIHAAAPHGPRYDPGQTEAERRSPKNGIWLCRTCGTKVDNDEERYPAGGLVAWKTEAETRARMRLESHSPTEMLEYGAEATSELLRWPTVLPDGSWIQRPELDRLSAMIRGVDDRPVVVLGAPGSGKSALLARFALNAREEGFRVVAIKADRLPAEIATRRQLGTYLGFPIPVAMAIGSIARGGPTVVVIDQLDALADLIDVRTERLSVLVQLIHDLVGAENVRIVCSAREFDYRHDARFEQIDAREVRLELPALAEVDAALSAAGHDPNAMPGELRSLLRVPQWLKTFLGLRIPPGESVPATWHALVERLWSRSVDSPRETASEREGALRHIAKTMADREELWVPVATLHTYRDSIDRLVSHGLLTVDAAGHRVGFAHQLIYEFARARTFLGEESLVEHVLERQGSLFVRPTLWTALGYLRRADRSRYERNVAALWATDVRPHIRLLLVEFLGQQHDPSELEATIFLPCLANARWQRAAFAAAAGSRGWFDRIREAYLPAVMLGPAPQTSLPVLTAAARFEPDLVLALVERCWRRESRCASCTIEVVRSIAKWDERVFTLANWALSVDGAKYDLDGLAWELKQSQPEFAIRLAAASLERELDRLLDTVVATPEVPPGAPREERELWHLECEPRRSLGVLLSSVSNRHPYLDELAALAPGVLLQRLLPWFSRLLLNAIKRPARGQSYLNDYLLGSIPDEELPRELANGLQTAARTLAGSDPTAFLELLATWSRSEFASIHVVMCFGLEVLAPIAPSAVVAYLLDDPRRLAIGDDDERSVELLVAVRDFLSVDDVGRLEEAICASTPNDVGPDLEVGRRWRATQANRRHRLALLQSLPIPLMSASTRRLVDREAHAVAKRPRPRKFSGRMRSIESPMAASQMLNARDEHVVRLFEGLTDSTEWDHPNRWMDGGSVQASREFASFAKLSPERAISISRAFKCGAQEGPAGDMLVALADGETPTIELETLVGGFDARGFSTEAFRSDASDALGKRAPDLGDSTIDLLASWLTTAPRAPVASPETHRGEPPFLWGFGGAYGLPRGNFPMLSTLTYALLSPSRSDTDRWIELRSRFTDPVFRVGCDGSTISACPSARPILSASAADFSAA